MLEQQYKCTWTVESLGMAAHGGDNEGNVYQQLQMECEDLRVQEFEPQVVNGREWNNNVTIKIAGIWIAGTWG